MCWILGVTILVQVISAATDINSPKLDLQKSSNINNNKISAVTGHAESQVDGANNDYFSDCDAIFASTTTTTTATPATPAAPDGSKDKSTLAPASGIQEYGIKNEIKRKIIGCKCYENSLNPDTTKMDHRMFSQCMQTEYSKFNNNNNNNNNGDESNKDGKSIISGWRWPWQSKPTTTNTLHPDSYSYSYTYYTDTSSSSHTYAINAGAAADDATDDATGADSAINGDIESENSNLIVHYDSRNTNIKKNNNNNNKKKNDKENDNNSSEDMLGDTSDGHVKMSHKDYMEYLAIFVWFIGIVLLIIVGISGIKYTYKMYRLRNYESIDDDNNNGSSKRKKKNKRKRFLTETRMGLDESGIYTVSSEFEV